eukprot:Gb_17087 [translate_table: standard]
MLCDGRQNCSGLEHETGTLKTLFGWVCVNFGVSICIFLKTLVLLLFPHDGQRSPARKSRVGRRVDGAVLEEPLEKRDTSRDEISSPKNSTVEHRRETLFQETPNDTMPKTAEHCASARGMLESLIILPEEDID